MEEDDISRKRLKKKVLDRWENEGGRLCDDLTKNRAGTLPRKRETTVPKLSLGITAAGNDNRSAGKREPFKK